MLQHDSARAVCDGAECAPIALTVPVASEGCGAGATCTYVWEYSSSAMPMPPPPGLAEPKVVISATLQPLYAGVPTTHAVGIKRRDSTTRRECEADAARIIDGGANDGQASGWHRLSGDSGLRHGACRNASLCRC